MFSERILKSLGSVAVRLTAWYAGILTLSFLVVFAAIYLVVRNDISRRMDANLLEEYQEILAGGESADFESLKEVLRQEGELDGVENMFLRIVGTEGRVQMSSDLSSWPTLDEISLSENGPSALPTLKTLEISGREYPVRMLSVQFGAEKTLQIGITLEKDRQLLEHLGKTALIAMVMVISGAVAVGWFMARRSLSGVEAVRRTALEITEGAFKKRVPTQGSGDEIDRLAETFNVMVDRIEKLILETQEFTDNVAHDLRAPISRIRGTAEAVLIRDCSVEDYQASLGTTIEECDRLISLVNTLLDLSELESGTSNLARDTIGIDDLIRDMVELFEPGAQGEGVTLELQLDCSGDVVGDRNSLQRALANLIDNAVKFTPAGGKVTLSSVMAGDQARVTVADSGCGISPSQLPHIFDRFNRGDRSRSDLGNGLGLCLSKALIIAHGGDISVESAPNQGAIFNLTLPLATG